jgi:hypothetical protein
MKRQMYGRAGFPNLQRELIASGGGRPSHPILTARTVLQNLR